jgi:tetratricopeptide (TPR) repeat protein
MIPVLLVVIVLVLGGIFVMFVLNRSKGDGGKRPKREKGRDAALRDANKRLAQNPRDPEGLTVLGDLAFREEDWNKVLTAYAALIELAPTNTSINEFEVNLRYGIAAMKLGMTNDAYKALSLASTFKQGNFEVSANLGALEFQRKNYEKAIQLLQQARGQDPEHVPTLRYLGHAFFKIKKYKEAMSFIRKAIDLAPEDKESLYTLAECYYEANQIDQALKIFGHLRADPQMGANACLMSGTICMDQHQGDRAIEDFEIGLKHTNIKPDVAIDIKYRLATAYLKQNEIGKALTYLREIQQVNQAYKDVSTLISRYQELNANRNLQIFLMAPSADFVALCR